MKLTKKQIEENKKRYKEAKKEQGHDILLSKEEVENLNETLFGKDAKNVNNDLQLANEENYSKFNDMGKYYRSFFASRAIYKFQQEVGEGNFSLNDEKVRDYVTKNAMNCSFRLGLSILKATNKQAKELDTFASNVVLQNTLMPTSPQKLKEVFGESAEKDSQTNLAKQKIMAKNFFMATVGKYNLKSKQGEQIELKEPLSETFVHGSRTVYILPYGGDQKAIMESIYGKEPEKTAGFMSRKAATHSLTKQKVNSDGTVKSFAKEEKVPGWRIDKSLPKQFGMNFAGGGLGNIGPNKKPITFNGTAGHMYTRKELGDNTTCGTLMVGFETSDSSETDFTGHQHNMLAKASNQSSFLADKSVVGKKIDGRNVDLSGLDANKFITLMNEFDRVYSGLQQKALGGDTTIKKFNEMICGKRLDTKELIQTLEDFGFDKNILSDTIIPAREGYTARQVVKEDKIIVPNENELKTWKANFDNIGGGLKIDANNINDRKRLYAIEKVDGKWQTKPLFDEKHNNAKDFYKRMKSISLSGGKIIAFGLGDKNAKEIELSGDKLSLKTAKEENLQRPQKPSGAKRFMNAITFGRAYKSDIANYKASLAQFNEKQEINDLIDVQTTLHTSEIKQEVSNANRISLDSEKLKRDLGMEKSKDIQKSEKVSEKTVVVNKNTNLQ